VRHPDGVTPELRRSARFEIEIGGERYPAEASLRAFYDPDGKRMRV
jgi:4-methylaminobutanoate oxidase (formaldehyde-forming)